MRNIILRAAEYRGLAAAAELSRDGSGLAEVRAKHERARLAWAYLADAEEARLTRLAEANHRAVMREGTAQVVAAH